MNNLMANTPNMLRLKNLKNLVPSLMDRRDRELEKINNPDLSGTGNVNPLYMPKPPEPSPMPPIGEGYANIATTVAKLPYLLPQQIAPAPPAEQSLPMEQQAAPEEQSVFSRIGQFLGNLVKQGGKYPELEQEQIQPLQKENAQIFPSQENPPPSARAAGQEQVIAPPVQEPVIPEPLVADIEQKREAAVNDISKPPVTDEVKAKLETEKPGTFAVPGAFDTAMQDPKFKDEYERIIGTPITPEMQQQVSAYEKVVNEYLVDIESAKQRLTQNELEIKQRLDAHNLTTFDKIMFGAALLAPIIIGAAAGGKEGLLAGLGASGKGLSTYFEGVSKKTEEAQNLLNQLALGKAELSASKIKALDDKAKYDKAIQDLVPNKALQDLFKKDGEILYDKEGKPELALNIGYSLLPVKSESIRDEKDVEQRKKDAAELSKKLAISMRIHENFDKMNQILLYAQQRNKDLIIDPLHVVSLLKTLGQAYFPLSGDTFIDENGQKVTLKNIFESLWKQVQPLYRQIVSPSVQNPSLQAQTFEETLPNPFDFENIFEGRGDYPTARSLIGSVRHNIDNYIIDTANMQGFVTSKIEDLFNKKNPAENLNKNGQIPSKSPEELDKEGREMALEYMRRRDNE